MTYRVISSDQVGQAAAAKAAQIGSVIDTFVYLTFTEDLDDIGQENGTEGLAGRLFVENAFYHLRFKTSRTVVKYFNDPT